MIPVPILFGLLSQGILETVERRTCEERDRRETMLRTAGVFDSVQCPGVDLEKYEAECRAMLVPNAWNRWRLLRSNADEATPLEIEKTARALLVKLIPSAVRLVTVKVGGDANPWGAAVIANRNSVCMSPMSVRSPADGIEPPYVNVYVEFIPRGPHTSIPWPARKVDLGFGSNCPVNADWLLDAVFAPSQQDVPPESGDSPLPPTLDPDNEGLDALLPDDEVPWYVWGAGGLAVAAVIAYVVRAFR